MKGKAGPKPGPKVAAKKTAKTPAKKTARGKTMNAKAAMEEAREAAAEKADSVTLRLPEAKYARDLGDRVLARRTQAASTSSSATAMISEGVEKRHINRPAFAQFIGFLKKFKNDPASARVQLLHFEHLMEKTGLRAEILAQGDLFDDEGDGDEEGNEADDNVVRGGNFGQKLKDAQGENYGRPAPVEEDMAPREVPEAAGA